MIRDRVYDPTDYASSIEREASRLSPFLVGALAGAAVALLFAPMSGRESRDKLKDGARRLRGATGDGLDRAHNALEDGAHAVRDAVASGKEVVRESVAAAREGFNRARDEARDTLNQVRDEVRPGTMPGTTVGSRKV